MSTAASVVTVLVAVLFTFTGSIKLLKVRQSLEIRDHLGTAPGVWSAIGAAELAGVAGVLVGFAYLPLGVAAAVGLAVLGLGALASHVRARDGVAEFVAAGLAVGLPVLALVLSAAG